MTAACHPMHWQASVTVHTVMYAAAAAHYNVHVYKLSAGLSHDVLMRSGIVIPICLALHIRFWSKSSVRLYMTGLNRQLCLPNLISNRVMKLCIERLIEVPADCLMSVG